MVILLMVEEMFPLKVAKEFMLLKPGTRVRLYFKEKLKVQYRATYRKEI